MGIGTIAKIVMLPNALSTCWPMADWTRVSKSPNRPKMKKAATVLTAMKAMPTGRPANISSRIEPNSARRIQYHSIQRVSVSLRLVSSSSIRSLPTPASPLCMVRGPKTKRRNSTAMKRKPTG